MRKYLTSIDFQQFLHPKFFISLLIWLFSYFMNAVVGGSLAFYHFPRVFPKTNLPEQLPDYGYDLIPYFCPTFLCRNPQTIILSIFYIAVLFGAIKTPIKGRIIVQQMFHINSLAFLARTTTVGLTGLPQPNPLCVKIQSEHASFKDAIKFVLIDHFNRPPGSCGDFIFSRHRLPGSCGDLIFSGHMAAIASCMVIFHKYNYLEGPIAYSFGWMLCLVSIFSLIACRSHYSVDVVLALYFVYFIKDWYFFRSGLSKTYIHTDDEYLTKLKQSSLVKLIAWLEDDRKQLKNYR